MTTVPAREGIIYGLSCTCHPDDGIRYVGQTVDPENRLRQHRRLSRGVSGAMTPALWWIRKHGEANILMIELARASQVELDALEVEYIQRLGTFGTRRGLNCTRGGAGVKAKVPVTGGKHHLSSLTDEQALQVYEMVKLNEWSLTEIAEAYGTTRGVVSCIASGKTYKNLGLPSLGSQVALRDSRGVRYQAKLSNEQVREIHARYGAGESSRSLGKEFQVTDVCIQQIARGKTHTHLNLPRVTRHHRGGTKGGTKGVTAGSKNHFSKLNDESARAIHALMASGSDRHEVASTYGVTWESVMNIAKGKTWKHLGLTPIGSKT